jgi:hypothetical protein
MHARLASGPLSTDHGFFIPLSADMQFVPLFEKTYTAQKSNKYLTDQSCFLRFRNYLSMGTA